MPEPVRIVVLGNSFASRIQLPALRHAGGARVVGIAGRDLEKARRTAAEWEIPAATDDWRSLLEEACDLVLVTTPVHLHREMTLAALSRGAAVLCEKPFALDAGEAEELVAAAAGGRGAWLDHELRWSPHVRRLRQLVQEGFLGEPWNASVEMHVFTPGSRRRPYSWWYDAARGGGMLGAVGSHLIDLLRWIVGAEVVAVRCDLATYVPERPDEAGVVRRVTADEEASVQMRFTDGVRAHVATANVLPRLPRFLVQLSGSDGHLRLVDGEDLSSSPDGREWEAVATEPLPRAEELGMPEYGVFGRCLPSFLREVVAAVAAGRNEVSGAATFADGLAVQRILDAARRSASGEGGWVPC